MQELIELEKRIDALLDEYRQVVREEAEASNFSTALRHTHYITALKEVKTWINNIKKQKEAGIDSEHLKAELF